MSTSNQSAYDVAVELWEPGDSAGDMTHALDWGQYGDLQRGDYDKAALWIERMEGVARRNPGQERVQNALPRVKARFVLETRQWQTLPVTDDSSAVELLATGISAVETGDLKLASEAAERLQQLAAAASTEKDTSYYSRTTQPLQIMHKQVAGLLAIGRGETDRGLAQLKDGVAIAESMRPPNGAPNPVKPVHELYASRVVRRGPGARGDCAVRQVAAAHAQSAAVSARSGARLRCGQVMPRRAEPSIENWPRSGSTPTFPRYARQTFTSQPFKGSDHERTHAAGIHERARLRTRRGGRCWNDAGFRCDRRAGAACDAGSGSRTGRCRLLALGSGPVSDCSRDCLHEYRQPRSVAA